MFGAAAAEEIVFGANMTTLAFHLARALGRGWGTGDEIVVTQLDHQANVAPWQALVRERGVTVRMVHFDPESGELDLHEFARCIGARRRRRANRGLEVRSQRPEAGGQNGKQCRVREIELRRPGL